MTPNKSPLPMSLALTAIAVTSLAAACAYWKPSPRHVGDSLGDPCEVDKDCDSQWCVNGRCDHRDG